MNKFAIVHYTRGQGLQANVNPERGKLFPHFIGVDADRLKLFAGGVFDFVYTDDPAIKIAQVERVVKLGGYVILSEKVYAITKDGIKEIDRYKKPAHKTAAVVRYGGFGDMLQMSSILPGLKRQGFHVTVFTHTKAKDIVKEDPNIDDFFLMDKDQMPNEWLGDFWDYHRPRFDRFINLSESVEGSLLALEYRTNYYWPKEMLHAYMDHNYVEVTHKIAQVPYKPEQRFYPTEEEKAWAEDFKEDLNGGPIILWVLSGSSVHKVWPYVDHAIARILITHPNARIVMAGDEVGAMGEMGWENEPRVIRTCTDWEIRQTLSFADVADVVIGPETGVLNSVSMQPMAKIMFMSHSSPKNNGYDWKNTTLLEPHGCRCYPCHKLHYSFAHCSRDEKTGVSECQAKISLEHFWAAFNRRMPSIRKAA